MNGGDTLLSNEAIIHLVLLVVYVPVCAITYRRLIPRLSLTCKRLAGGMLAAQIVAVVMALQYRPKSGFEVWLWNLEQEWNIPTTLTSTQLALVGVIALITAWLAKKRPAWERLYLVSISLIFPYLALDEYFKLHEHRLLAIPYSTLGAITVIATILVALRSPRQKLVWHVGMLAGIAIGVIGGIVVDKMPPLCDSFLLFPLDGCLQLTFWEESLELLGIWLTLVAMLGHLSDTVSKPKLLLRCLLYMLPALCILLLILGPIALQLEFRLRAQPADVQFESGVSLRGYRIDSDEKSSHLQLYMSARPRDYIGRGVRMGFSVHLVDQESGASVASLNESAHIPQDAWLFGPGYAPLFRNHLAVPFPPATPVNRAYWIVLTIWRKKETGHDFQKIITSDRQLLSNTQAILGELAIPAKVEGAAIVPAAVFNNGFSLGAVSMPERINPGETLPVSFLWRSDVRGQEDLTQFLHFVAEENDDLWNHDQQPLGPRLPTRLWYPGLADSETWHVPVPADLAPGRYNVFTGLYRARDRERAPAMTAGGASWPDARVRLGTLIVEQ